MLSRWSTLPVLATVVVYLLTVSGPVLSQEKRNVQLNEKGEFTADTPKDREKTDCPSRLYALNCVSGRTYTIEMRSEDFDTYLRLEDPSGKTIKTDDDSGGGAKGTDARLVFKADKTGAYTIAATSYGGGVKGKYTLIATHDGAGIDEAIAYVLDTKSKLAKDDPKDKDRGGVCYFKAFKVEMADKATYVIQLDSHDFDAYMRLLDAEGKEVAHDDDGARDGLNAKLVYTCSQAGTYTIIATSFAHPDTGEFHLRVHMKK